MIPETRLQEYEKLPETYLSAPPFARIAIPELIGEVRRLQTIVQAQEMERSSWGQQ